MAWNPNCVKCLAIVGACVSCGGCFDQHCECDPCQHGYSREKIMECVQCRPITLEDLAALEDAANEADDLLDTPTPGPDEGPYDEIRQAGEGEPD